MSASLAIVTWDAPLWVIDRSELAYFNAVERGGHFAAWEEPELFSAELRAAFSALR